MIYLLYSLYFTNSLAYYFNTNLFRKVKFEKNYLFTHLPETYSHLLILEEFYNVTQIISLLIHHPKETSLIVNAVSLSMKNQRPSNCYLILHIVTYFAEPKIVDILNQ